MVFALAKFSALYKAFNRRALNERDFFRLCKIFEIEVCFECMPLLQGFHAKIGGKIFIYLDKNLTGTEFLYIAFHELAHALLHESTKVTEINFFNQFTGRNEDEAETVALIALFPTRSVKNLNEELLGADEFLTILINKRLEVYRQTGI